MNFLAPWMQWATIAGVIPIVIHLAFRTHYRTIAFPAFDLLRLAEMETRRRTRWLEALMLLARIAMMVMLALALARPSTAGSGGGPVDAVVVLDTSIGMDAREDGRSRIQQARAAARSLIESLPPHSTAQVIAASDRVDMVGPRRPSDLTAASAFVDSITVTVRSSDLGAAMPTALEALRRGAGGEKQLVLISSFDSPGWSRSTATIGEALQSATRIGQVCLARVGSRSPINAAVVDLTPHTGVPRAGERIGFAVLVKNVGPKMLRHLSVSLTPDGDLARRETQPIDRLDPGETRSVTLTAKWARAGAYRVTARVQSDELPADDVAERIVTVRDKVRVLVVDGEPARAAADRGASFFLLHSLSPVRDGERPGYHIQPSLVAASQAAPSLLGDRQLCILVNCAMPGEAGETLSPEFLDALGRFVRSGGALLVFVGDRVWPESYNAVLGDRLGLMPGQIGDAHPVDVGIDRTRILGAAFEKFRDGEAYRGFASVRTQRRVAVQESLPSHAGVPMRFADGAPLVVTRPVGMGAVALVTTSADMSWTELPIQINAYVPLIDALMTHLLAAGNLRQNVSAEAGLEWFVSAADSERSYSLVQPGGARRRLGLPTPIEGRYRVTTSDTPVAGLYRLVPSDAPDSAGIPFAVSPVAPDSPGVAATTNAVIDQQLGFAPSHVTIGTDPTQLVAAAARAECTPLLLGILVAWAVVESLLSLLCDRVT